PALCSTLVPYTTLFRSVQRVHQPFCLARRKEPVAGEGDDAEAGLGVAKGFCKHPTMIRSQIEVVHGTSDVEVGVGVEALDETGRSEEHTSELQSRFDLV